MEWFEKLFMTAAIKCMVLPSDWESQTARRIFVIFFPITLPLWVIWTFAFIAIMGVVGLVVIFPYQILRAIWKGPL